MYYFYLPKIQSMGTFKQILYQIVFSTYKREPTLTKPNRQALFRYISGVLNKKNCHVYSINGVEDHLHIITDLHPSVSLANLIKDIKISSNGFIKKQDLFPDFQAWQSGYGAFTYHIEAKDNLIGYVKNQEHHHRKVDYVEELRALLMEHGIEFDERFLL
jgi:REP element-mobilizing transposase RayT